MARARVLHVDDEYGRDASAFVRLRRLLADKGFDVVGCDFSEAVRRYERLGGLGEFPQVVILDLMDGQAAGSTATPGEGVLVALIQEFAAASNTEPHVVVYSGADDVDTEIIGGLKSRHLRVFGYDMPERFIVRKTSDPERDCKLLVKGFPVALGGG